MSAQPQVVVVEDHPSMRLGLELLLGKRGFRITGSAASYAEGSAMIEARRPDVAVIDIKLGDGSGTALAQAVAETCPRVAIVLYTGYVDHHLLEEAVDSGASAVVLKASPFEDLARAVLAAAKGGTFVDPRVSASLRSSPLTKPPKLSRREVEVLGLVAGGCTSAQVGAELHLSELTVDTHVRNACAKLGAQGRLHAVVMALESGDLELGHLPKATA